MKKRTFYTEQFYQDPNLTLDLLNQLLTTKYEYVNEVDMYDSGTFFVFEVLRNEETEKMVSSIISDLDDYTSTSNKHYSYNGQEIDFSLLVEDHKKTFDTEYEIVWDHENKRFCFTGSLWEEEEV